METSSFFLPRMIHWNVSPIAFDLGFIAPRWYGVLFATAFFLSYVVMRKIYEREKRTQVDLDALTITVIVSTIVGARLGHVFFYEPSIMLNDPLETFAVWHGGLASHGGALGIITGLWIYHKRRPSFSFIWLLDRIAIVAALSGMCIRIGNLFNSEIIGHQTTVPWAFVFERVDMLPRHPTQIYEALVCLVLFIVLWRMYNAGVATRNPGRLIGMFLVLLFTARFFIEFLKERQVDFENSLPIDMGQILSIPFVVVGAWLLLRDRAK
jgi:phosphatidylglycerol:prolipoprotein diacylglycerol transferase